MIFKYKGVDKKSGKKVKGVLEAHDLQEAKSRLLAKNILYTSIKESSVSLLDKISFKRKASISNQELATLSRDLAIYLRAGIPIANALRLAQNQYAGNKKIYNFLGSLICLLYTSPSPRD